MKLSELIKEQDIVLGIQADRKRSALAAVAARLGISTGKGQSSVLNALLRRERLGSTAVGHGVAIPHARLDDITAPAAVVASLERPVFFDSPDDDPVDLIVSLVWPTSDRDGFVPALARFCRLLRQPGLCDRLRSAPSPSAALVALRSFEEKTGRLPAPSLPGLIVLPTCTQEMVRGEALTERPAGYGVMAPDRSRRSRPRFRGARSGSLPIR